MRQQAPAATFTEHLLALSVSLSRARDYLCKHNEQTKAPASRPADHDGGIDALLLGNGCPTDLDDGKGKLLCRRVPPHGQREDTGGLPFRSGAREQWQLSDHYRCSRPVTPAGEGQRQAAAQDLM